MKKYFSLSINFTPRNVDYKCFFPLRKTKFRFFYMFLFPKQTDDAEAKLRGCLHFLFTPLLELLLLLFSLDSTTITHKCLSQLCLDVARHVFSVWIFNKKYIIQKKSPYVHLEWRKQFFYNLNQFWININNQNSFCLLAVTSLILSMQSIRQSFVPRATFALSQKLQWFPGHMRKGLNDTWKIALFV